MASVEVLFFDVLGTVVDWRGSIASEVTTFLQGHNVEHIDPHAFADDWVGRYDGSADAVRSGQRPYVTLDVLNMENLRASLIEFRVKPSDIAPTDLEGLNQAWHRLKPWPDSVEGISRLKRRYIVAPLSDGHTRMLVNMAKHAGLPWDAILGADIFRAYKPMPEVYLGACQTLGVSPGKAMLVAAHDYDLDGAHRCGLKTAYISRQNAADPSKNSEAKPVGNWDYTAHSLVELAEVLDG